MKQPLLSICLSGRNDNYGRDFKRRFVQAMNLMAWSAERAGVLSELEVVFTDWNSDVPLAREIKFNHLAAKMVRFIIVPPEMAQPLNFPGTAFHTGLSLNVAFRRAQGRFIAMMPSDIMFTQYALRSLFAVLKKEYPLPFCPREVVMGVPRKFLATQIDDARHFADLENTEALLATADWYLQNGRYCRALNGDYGMWIVDAENLRAIRGTLESIGGWGYSDTDLAMRLADKLKMINLSGFGVSSYDFGISISEYRTKDKKIRFKLKNFALGKVDNPSDWGMAGITLQEEKAQVGEYIADIAAEETNLPTVPELILWHSRVVSGNLCRKITKLAFAAAETMRKSQAHKVLLWGIKDVSVPMALSLLEPMLEMIVVENQEDNVTSFEELDQVLAECGHHGPVHYSPELPQETFLANLDMIIVQNLPFPQALADKLNAKGYILAKEKLPIAGKQEILLDQIYFYSRVNAILFSEQKKWEHFSGNLILRRSLSQQLVRLWNILMRVPVRRLSYAIRTLRRILN